MNKAELIESISKKTDLSKVQIEKIFNTLIETIQTNVKSGKEVKIVGFGTFTKSKRKARTGRNPLTGKTMDIPAAWVPKFRAGTDFKSTVQ